MSHRAMTFFNKAAKMVPVISAMAGACMSAAGGYIAIKSELTELARHNEYTEAKLEAHITGWDHDVWFSDDWIRHPALRSAIERYITREQERENNSIHSCYSRAAECQSRWDRFFELNPAIVRPGSSGSH